MAEIGTITDSFSIGSKRMVLGTWTQAVGGIGGTIATGLQGNAAWHDVKQTTGATMANFITSISSGSITVTTTPAPGTETGTWVAIGN